MSRRIDLVQVSQFCSFRVGGLGRDPIDRLNQDLAILRQDREERLFLSTA